MTASIRASFTLFSLVALLLAGTAIAQPWPSRPLRVVVPFLAGSFTDVAARTLAVELSEQTRERVIVDNRPGAGGTIGIDLVAKATPDGHTLLLTENSFTVSPALYAKLPYDPIRDFAPVTVVAEAPTVLWARPDLPTRSLKELVELARAKPGTLTFGSGGQGTSSHLAAELFFDKVKIKVVHVPFKGVAGSINEVVAGRIDFGTSSLASPLGQIRAGRLRALALTGKQRNQLLPDVPTFAEAGFSDYDAPIWFGVLLPAGTPAQRVARLHSELVTAVDKPKTHEVFATQGAQPVTTTPGEFARRIQREVRQWRDLVSRTGIRIE